MVSQAKTGLRSEILGRRDSLPAEDIAAMSDSIAGTLAGRPRFAEAKRVAFYMPKGSEVDTRMMIFRAMQAGKEVMVPVTDHKITMCRLRSLSGLKQGKYGIPEPQEKEPPSGEPEAIIVPGAAFGLCMHRIGYGKGYYDRYLAGSPAYRIGVCYDFQLVERLPFHKDDQRMDEIITEKRTVTL